MVSDSSLHVDLVDRYADNPACFLTFPDPDQFVDSIDTITYRHHLKHRNVIGSPRPLALYVHVPGRNSQIDNQSGIEIVPRLKLLRREIELVFNAMSPIGSRLERIRCEANGLSLPDMAILMRTIRLACKLTSHSECSVDLTSKEVDKTYLEGLFNIGFTELNIVMRNQDIELAEIIVALARQCGFASIKLDFADEMPDLEEEIFRQFLQMIIASQADEIKFWRGSTSQRSARLALADERLKGANYIFLGADSFAKVNSITSIAYRRGRLTWDQGCVSTEAPCDWIGIGPSAISTLSTMSFKNVGRMEDYAQKLSTGHLPIEKGIILSHDQLVRRSVIEALLCHHKVSLKAIGMAFLIDWETYFAKELAQLRNFSIDGLIEQDEDWLILTALGRFFVLSVCRIFSVRN